MPIREILEIVFESFVSPKSMSSFQTTLNSIKLQCYSRMSDIVESIKSVLDGPIDYKSQKFTEQLSYKVLIVGAVISSLAGFAVQDIRTLLAFSAITILITLAIVVPPYPGYNNQKIEWYTPTIVSRD